MIALGTLLSSALCFGLAFPVVARGQDAWQARRRGRATGWLALCGLLAVIGALGPHWGFDLWSLYRAATRA